MNKRKETVHDVRYADTPLTWLLAIELHPCVMDGVISNSETIDGSPQPKTTPFPDMRMNCFSNYENDQITRYRYYDNKATSVCPVT